MRDSRSWGEVKSAPNDLRPTTMRSGERSFPVWPWFPSRSIGCPNDDEGTRPDRGRIGWIGTETGPDRDDYGIWENRLQTK